MKSHGMCKLKVLKGMVQASISSFILCTVLPLSSGQLLTPGTMAPYTGGGQRARGFGYVREPAEGFFIGGSSIKEMNGVYKRVSEVPWWISLSKRRLREDTQVPSDIKHKFQLAYRKWPVDEHDDMRGWHLALVDAPGVSGRGCMSTRVMFCTQEGATYQTVGGKRSEWLFIDPERRDRFGHAGETIIPGSGTSWQHLHRAHVTQQAEASGSEIMQAGADDEDELPWQVIFIGDAAVSARSASSTES
eukprot:764321-Hanusia_phi.AAC.5